jgi:hypothetical protein
MTTSPNYSELVAEAERSVQGVKDPELRRIAFQKVLEELISGGTGSGRGSRRERRAKKARGGKATVSRKSSRSGPTSYLLEMVEDGFFKKPKAITDVKVELENQGHHIPLTSLSGPLQTLCKRKKLRRQRSEGRFLYSNW